MTIPNLHLICTSFISFLLTKKTNLGDLYVCKILNYLFIKLFMFFFFINIVILTTHLKELSYNKEAWRPKN